MKIGDRIFVRGYIDEIRKDTVIVRNDGGYFGTIPSEVITGELPPAQPETHEERTGTHGVCLDAISRQDAIDAINEIIRMEHSLRPKVYVAKDAIKALPSAQPKKGRWISADAMFHGVPFYCSECGENTRDTVMGKPRYNFCPMCGAKMEVTT